MPYLGNYPEIQQYTLQVDKFNGTGACTQYTLSRTIDDPVAVDVWVNSVPQTPYDAYTLSQGVITFTEAPSVGTNNIVAIHRSSTVYTRVQVGTSDIQDGAITAAKIADGTIVAAEIADNTITGAKLQTDIIRANNIVANQIGSNTLTTTGVTSGTYGGASNVSVITVDTAGRITSASNVAISIPTQYETVNAIPTMLMLSGM